MSFAGWCGFLTGAAAIVSAGASGMEVASLIASHRRKSLIASNNEVANMEFPKFDPSNPSHRVLVLTVEKTASSSVAGGLEKVLTSFKTWDPDVPERTAGPEGYTQGIRTHDYDTAHDFLERTEVSDEIWVVTSVRHTFSRCVSEFFQKAEPAYGRERFMNMSIKELGDAFEFGTKDGHDVRTFGNFYWLSEIFGPALHIDPSDLVGASQLQSQWKGRKLNIMVQRVEDIATWNDKFSAVFPGFSLPAENVGDAKWYDTQYQKFKENWAPSESMLRELADKDQFKIFYSKEEQDEFLRAYLTKQ